MEYQIAEFFVLSFLVGLTGCLTPGPTLIVTIELSLFRGWQAGPLVTVGHILTEGIIAIAITFGFSYFFSGYTAYVSYIGGVALILFGILTLKSSTKGMPQNTENIRNSRPIYAGFVTAVSNPFFWFWWMTIGAGFLLDGLASGIIFGITFMTGHWLADIGWFTFVSVGIGKGKNIISERIYMMVLVGCGLFLILFGLFFLITGNQIR